MNIVFADAGYWIALRNRGDANHERAVRVAHRLIQDRSRIVVTSFVFAEAYAYVSRKRPVRERLMRDIWENPIVQVEQADFEDQRKALTLLKAHVDKSFSFSDALSFVVMERLALTKAVSFDKHFRQYGNFEIIDDV